MDGGGVGGGKEVALSCETGDLQSASPQCVER